MNEFTNSTPHVHRVFFGFCRPHHPCHYAGISCVLHRCTGNRPGCDRIYALNRAGGLAGPAIDAEVPTNRTIGWWASASTIDFSAPTKVLNISTRYNNFTVAPADFVGYTGNWYLVNPATGMAIIGSEGLPRRVFTVNDPYLDIRIWDFDLAEDMSGKITTGSA
jgi:hypothetical protein